MSRRFRFAYLVSGWGRLLQAVLDASVRYRLPYEVALVIADHECEAIERAQRMGVRHAILHEPRERFDPALLAMLKDENIDGLILNFDRLLGADICRAYAGRILNTHFSLLPLFPGFGAIRASVASGMRFGGVTVHLVDESVDGGPIVAQAAVPMPPAASEETLGAALFDAAVPLQLQAMEFLAAGRLREAARKIHIEGARYGATMHSPSLEAPYDQWQARKEVL